MTWDQSSHNLHVNHFMLQPFAHVLHSLHQLAALSHRAPADEALLGVLMSMHLSLYQALWQTASGTMFASQATNHEYCRRLVCFTTASNKASIRCVTFGSPPLVMATIGCSLLLAPKWLSQQSRSCRLQVRMPLQSNQLDAWSQ